MAGVSAEVVKAACLKMEAGDRQEFLLDRELAADQLNRLAEKIEQIRGDGLRVEIMVTDGVLHAELVGTSGETNLQAVEFEGGKHGRNTIYARQWVS
jgi:hypothetical protein